MPSLPIELYRPIFSAADRDTLRSLALTSRLLQREAERIIYREISIPFTSEIDAECVKLLNKPRIFDLVFKLDITQAWIETATNLAPETTTYFDVLAPVLSNLSNLIVLSFDTFSGMPPEGKCGKIFEGCTFQLRKFHCPFVLDDDLLAFLNKQSEIMEWTWTPIYTSSRDLPAAALPKLAVFSFRGNGLAHGPVPPTSLITTGRPITHVGWQVDQLPSFRSLTLSTSNVVALIIYHKQTNSQLLRELPDHLPLLEFLAFLPLNRERYTILSDVLPRLKHLRAIEVMDIYISEEAQLKTVTELHRLSPSLRAIRVRHLAGRSDASPLYEWDELKQSWIPPHVEKPSNRNLFAESVRRTHKLLRL